MTKRKQNQDYVNLNNVDHIKPTRNEMEAWDLKWAEDYVREERMQESENWGRGADSWE